NGKKAEFPNEKFFPQVWKPQGHRIPENPVPARGTEIFKRPRRLYTKKDFQSTATCANIAC
ncbi:MAG TPA: hypothetical protein PLD92_05110, partial [Candidatus Omnitrophota bacterium]|nr:hypothetical protein [Candidatus Omnitrophota bacterium]